MPGVLLGCPPSWFLGQGLSLNQELAGQSQGPQPQDCQGQHCAWLSFQWVPGL